MLEAGAVAAPETARPPKPTRKADAFLAAKNW
jgi:hypothetical protein